MPEVVFLQQSLKAHIRAATLARFLHFMSLGNSLTSNQHSSGALTNTESHQCVLCECVCSPLKHPTAECTPYSDAIKRRLTRVES